MYYPQGINIIIIDTLNVRTVGGELDTNFRDTVKLWWDVYNERYYIKGGSIVVRLPWNFLILDGHIEKNVKIQVTCILLLHCSR